MSTNTMCDHDFRAEIHSDIVEKTIRKKLFYTINTLNNMTLKPKHKRLN